MLFRRRQPQTLRQRLRAALWPRKAWHRGMRYFAKRVLRLNATPHAVAAGFAAGIFATFTPFLGFHFLIAFAIAYAVGGNLAAAVLGCLAGNPLTYPAIWAVTYELGRFMLGAAPVPGHAPHRLRESLMEMDVSAIWTPYLKPMLVGSIPLSVGSIVISYPLLYWGVRSFQRHRSHRILAKRRALGASPLPAGEGLAG